MVSFASSDCWPLSLRSESMWRFAVSDVSLRFVTKHGNQITSVAKEGETDREIEAEWGKQCVSDLLCLANDIPTSQPQTE
jgi:hypothetical protein